MDLPTAWNRDDKSIYLSVYSSGLRVNYEGLGKSQKESGIIRANHPIPSQCKLFYFEVDIINEGKNKIIGIGFCEKEVNLNRIPGWDDCSYGYHGDDGNFFCSGNYHPYGPSFSTGDTIGCCLNFKNNTVFYTKNGINLGIAFRNLKGTLYPCVGLRSQGGSIEVNFGSRKFKYAETTSEDIDDELLKKKWIGAFNMCINVTNVYTLEDLKNSLKIKHETALKFQGKFNCNMGSYENAIIDLTKLLDLEENSKFALKYRGEAYCLMGKYEDTIIDLTKLLDIEPNSKFALRYRGEAYYLMGKYEDAIIDLTKLLDIEPNSKFALRYRGEAYYKMEKYKESYKDVNKLLKIETNDEWASKLLAKIIEKDPCIDETYELGYFYLHGISVEKDEYKAFTQFEKSANMGHTEGINCLGYCYEYGIGVEKNENKAFTYYQKSADMYNSNGMYQVGYCYYLGIGVDIDKHKAFTYYLKSSEAGNSKGIRKTAICYYYGIGVEKNSDKFWELIDKDPNDAFIGRSIDNNTIILSSHSIRRLSDFISGTRHIHRSSKYGKCAHCNNDNTQPAWCLSCDPDIATRWTSGNKKIDDCMKTFQLRTLRYEDVIEWIPFDRLSEIKKIGQGGFSSVYSATWLDGIRKVDVRRNIKKFFHEKYMIAREQSSTVALKTFASSMENNNNFLKEFKSLMTCKINYSKLAIYGITQNKESKEYFMVFQYANKGSLTKYLRNNFCNLKWQTKLQILKDISKELDNIHYCAGYIHADFNSANILLDMDYIVYISDLGLSRKINENVSKGEVYGIMPYVAPEILLGEHYYTQAGDIYGFGVIMTEMTTGQRPLDGHKFGAKLAVKIIKGLRPELASETPKCYIELAEQCMESDPQKRPEAYKIYETISNWLDNITSSDDNEIKMQFLEADKVIKSLPILKHSNEIYTSKIIRTKLISKTIKDLSLDNSAQIKLDITKI